MPIHRRRTGGKARSRVEQQRNPKHRNRTGDIGGMPDEGIRSRGDHVMTAVFLDADVRGEVGIDRHRPGADRVTEEQQRQTQPVHPARHPAGPAQPFIQTGDEH